MGPNTTLKHIIRTETAVRSREGLWYKTARQQLSRRDGSADRDSSYKHNSPLDSLIYSRSLARPSASATCTLFPTSQLAPKAFIHQGLAVSGRVMTATAETATDPPDSLAMTERARPYPLALGARRPGAAALDRSTGDWSNEQ